MIDFSSFRGLCVQKTASFLPHTLSKMGRLATHELIFEIAGNKYEEVINTVVSRIHNVILSIQ